MLGGLLHRPPSLPLLLCFFCFFFLRPFLINLRNEINKSNMLAKCLGAATRNPRCCVIVGRQWRTVAVSMIRALSTAPRWKTYRLSARGSGNTCVSETSDGFKIRSDIPRAVGGDNSAPQPVYLLLAALVGCKQATSAFVAMKMRIELGSIAFDLTSRRDERGALTLPIDEPPQTVAMLQRIEGTATVETSATQSELDALGRQVALRCPVANMIELSGCVVDIKWRKVL